MIELGRRRQRLPAPSYVVWQDLCAPKQEGVRAWLALMPDETPPRLLAATEPDQVVWSSLWPGRPHDRILLNVAPDGAGSWLEFVWLAAGEPPSDAVVGHVRKRLNRLLYADLRYSYGN